MIDPQRRGNHHARDGPSAERKVSEDTLRTVRQTELGSPVQKFEATKEVELRGRWVG
jgi:hypothetical protein